MYVKEKRNPRSAQYEASRLQYFKIYKINNLLLVVPRGNKHQGVQSKADKTATYEQASAAQFVCKLVVSVPALFRHPLTELA